MNQRILCREIREVSSFENLRNFAVPGHARLPELYQPWITGRTEWSCMAIDTLLL